MRLLFLFLSCPAPLRASSLCVFSLTLVRAHRKLQTAAAAAHNRNRRTAKPSQPDMSQPILTQPPESTCASRFKTAAPPARIVSGFGGLPRGADGVEKGALFLFVFVGLLLSERQIKTTTLPANQPLNWKGQPTQANRPSL